jgi:hypothetical protein
VGVGTLSVPVTALSAVGFVSDPNVDCCAGVGVGCAKVGLS